MKIVRLVLGLATLLSIPALAQTKFVHTSGKEIVDGNGKPLHLRGTNLGNWMVPEGYMWRFEGGPQSPTEIEKFIVELVGPTRAAEFWRQYRDNYITQDDIRAIRAQGFNVIRVPLHWKFFQTDNDDGFRLLDRVVRWSHEAGLYVVLDLHAAEGGQTGYNIDDGDGYPWLFRDAGAQQQTVALWTRLARHYANDPTVLGYDLLNEPVPNYPGLEVLNPEVAAFYTRLSAAVRSVDKHHSLILGGAQWDNNFNIFHPPFDSNTIFTCHRYKAEPNQSAIKSFVEFRDKYNVPMWMGETGENTDEWVGSFRKVLEGNDIGWAFWPYKKMEITSAVATITPPVGWDQIVAYAKLPRGMGLVKDRQKVRPPQAVIDAALAGLLQNIRFANCKLNSGYIHALLPDAPQP